MGMGVVETLIMEEVDKQEEAVALLCDFYLENYSYN